MVIARSASVFAHDMSTIAGPIVQVPSMFVDQADPQWRAFHQSMQQTVYNASRSGPTASRPTSDQPGRFIGMPYFDTTLGLVVFLKSVVPDVWVRGDGTPV